VAFLVYRLSPVATVSIYKRNALISIDYYASVECPDISPLIKI
jgi:hypothetical protein